MELKFNEEIQRDGRKSDSYNNRVNLSNYLKSAHPFFIAQAQCVEA